MALQKNDEYLKAFGENLKAIRVKENITQAYLADTLGIEFTESE